MKLRTILMGTILCLPLACVGMMVGDTEMILGKSMSAQDLEQFSDDFYVTIHLMAPKSETVAYPETWAAFNRATDEWAKHLPIRWIVVEQFEDMPIPAELHSAIVVRLTNLEAEEFSSSILGVWNPYAEAIMLSADKLESKPSQAYSVRLHELGHMIGLPHFVNYDEIGRTGFIAVHPSVEAEDFVMYPNAVKGRDQIELSPLEISLAKQHLVSHWSRSDRKFQMNCDLHLSK